MIRPERLFSYGTLQDEGVQLAIFGRRLIGEKDALPGHRLGTLTITNPGVVGLSGVEEYLVAEPTGRIADSVEGVVFEISAEELAAADAYEDVDYRRVQARLASGLEAWLYVRA